MTQMSGFGAYRSRRSGLALAFDLHLATVIQLCRSRLCPLPRRAPSLRCRTARPCAQAER